MPENVRHLGHVDEIEKARLLSEAWVLVNTSIHEGLAISFLEAWACETPVISSVNPDGLVARFGLYVGEWPGTGMSSVPAFEDALKRMLCHEELRRRLGREGRAWVNAHHSRTRFLGAFCSTVRGMSRPLGAWAGAHENLVSTTTDSDTLPVVTGAATCSATLDCRTS